MMDKDKEQLPNKNIDKIEPSEECYSWLAKKMESDNDYRKCIEFLLEHYCED
jgi:hypothetical protein